MVKSLQNKKDAINNFFTFNIQRNVEFDGTDIKISGSEFNSLGFNYGDSVDVIFSNGQQIFDVPYYSGYYSRINTPVLVDYPAFEYLYLTYSNGQSSWNIHHLNEQETVSVRLSTAGKYSEIQQSMDLTYSTDRKLYSSDEEFANFRPLNSTHLKCGMFYRGASPADDQYKRANIVDRLIKKHKINYIIDLADNQSRLEKHFARQDFDSPYFKHLYENGLVSLCRLKANYQSREYATTVVSALRQMLVHDGPYYIHCTEGKDRTGFFCALLEVLAGDSYQTSRDDYMQTYSNYYGVLPSDTKKYKLIETAKFYDIYKTIIGVRDDFDFCNHIGSEQAEQYLKFGSMDKAEIEQLIDKIKQK